MDFTAVTMTCTTATAVSSTMKGMSKSEFSPVSRWSMKNRVNAGVSISRR